MSDLGFSINACHSPGACHGWKSSFWHAFHFSEWL